MPPASSDALIVSVLVVLAAGTVAGLLCRRLGVSMLVGYLIAGAVVGDGGLGLVAREREALEYVARGGVLFLLFSVGIEFPFEDLGRTWRRLAAGGSTQMALVAAPVAAACLAFGAAWQTAVLVGFALALSSTVLVFRALVETGQSTSPAGQRGIGILLFQDAALVPLMLLVPMLTRDGEAPGGAAWAALAVESAIFVVAVGLARWLIARRLVPMLVRLRSVELVVLLTLTLLGTACVGAALLGLPAEMGALAAGVALGGNRLSGQVDSIVLPYRELFAAVFFVTLGTLLEPGALLAEPVLLTAAFAGTLGLKVAAATAALRAGGLPWWPALGMGLGLAQVGELSFLLMGEGITHGVIDRTDYARLLFIALGSMMLTPALLRVGLRWTGALPAEDGRPDSAAADLALRHAVVVGAGPIGRQVATRLETMGVDVAVVDLSPINLHPFAQAGFRTATGDARDPDVLRRAGAERADLVVVAVPDDDAAAGVVRTARELQRASRILARCRYQGNVARLRQAGGDVVISEEAELSTALLAECDRLIG